MALAPQAQAQKIMTLLNQRQFPAAVKAAKAAQKANPRAWQFTHLYAMALAQNGQLKEAIPLFTKVLKQQPTDLDVQNNLISTLVEAGQHTQARQLISKLLPKRQKKHDLYQVLGLSHMRCNEHVAAIEAADKALAENPENDTAHNIRGISLIGVKRMEDAIAAFEEAHRLNPQNPEPLSNMSAALSHAQRFDEAMTAVEKALQLNPRHLTALHRFAALHSKMGNLNDAVALYRKILELDPYYAEAYSELVQAQTIDENKQLFGTLKTAISKIPKNSYLQVHLNLAMGNLLFKEKSYDKAAPYLSTANALVSKRRPHDFARATSDLEKTREMFPLDKPLPKEGDTETPRPIFVLGQPRSGTTLTEMMISASDEVVSCGEQPMAGQIAQAILQGSASFDAVEFAKTYREGLPSFAGDRNFFVDKMPANYQYIGFILSAFPEAPIIYIERDPRDVALSMWREFFTSAWMNFTFDMKAMAHSANLYQGYMKHWQALVGDRILNLNYADIVSDPEAASRKMAEFCGLEWSEVMMAPERNTARVSTASVVQVREGVHTKSLGGWRRLEKSLKPFVEALDPDLWPDLD
jgi:tetratricopeptide (TPR) repeat protein